MNNFDLKRHNFLVSEIKQKEKIKCEKFVDLSFRIQESRLTITTNEEITREYVFQYIIVKPISKVKHKSFVEF